MHILRNIFFFLVALAMLALGALFAVQNDAVVPLDLLVIYLPERSVALWVLLALALGGVLGLLTSLGIILRLRTRLAAAQKKLSRHTTQEAPVAEPLSKETDATTQQADA
ncbi:MAG: lipopolysaccharide assembly protein LapA domain-containing protein [Pseudomonadota bacterium]